jgi:CheY-like chemotaxis protein
LADPSRSATLRAADRWRDPCDDLVLMDVHLPDIDGYEAARRIAPLQPGTVIVLVSADDALFGDPTSICGASAFVRKEELRPTLLRELWDRHRVEAAAPE